MMNVGSDDARFPEMEADCRRRLLAEARAGRPIQVLVTTARGTTHTAMTHPVLQPDGSYRCDLDGDLKQPDIVRFCFAIEDRDDK